MKMAICPECKRSDSTHARNCGMYSDAQMGKRMMRLIITIAEDYQEGDTVSSSDIAEARKIVLDFAKR